MIPPPSALRSCDDCSALILWTVTVHNRRMAVDSVPDEAGNQAVYRDGLAWRSRSLDGVDAPPKRPWESLHKPHVATCGEVRPAQGQAPAPKDPPR
ncbi:hypothetical protein [Streptosporangium longisporum]|uniref:Uncharacterized protein n=1 Tax=Streptosporangium longisporum TaxID=46187 RepID=A0ABP6L2A2_9ACTN